ncbi:MAG: heavy-metal-associated domain-containing protein [Bacteroidales bacterium]|nr:heavy-metal-associated domain-containing protein [Bacteroidales bacterium]MBN2757071.1 heavy-metal-associated domain-containing protein [Bacteroidales bacterium]HES59589.1 copper chaperone [Caldithrix sp.]
MKTVIKVANLKCNGCATTIKNGINKYDEVISVEIDVENSIVNINFTGNMSNIEKYKKKLHKLGYPEDNNNNAISVAKSYVSCAFGKINSNN